MPLPPPIPVLVPWYDTWKRMNPGTENEIYDPTPEELDAFKLPPKIIYHYTSIESAKKIIEGHTLKFTNPDEFNDPFDMYNGLIDFKPKDNILKNWSYGVYKLGTRKDRRRLHKNAVRAGDKLIEVYKKSFADLKGRSGVCCFSKTKLNSLMWSHYARHHKGVCLGFNFHPLRNDVFFLREVDYVNKIERKNYYEQQRDALFYWVFTKSHIWSYEQEIRAILMNKPNDDLVSFDKGCLREIYFGCRTSEADKVSIISLLDQYNYKTSTKKKMIIDESTFDIVIADL